MPTPGNGLDGNSPEIAAAIEAGVKDGMNVLNFSIGEPEVTPKRDVVVDAIQAASAAGVVCVTAAGNDFADLGFGTVGSPASAPDAIAVAAVTNGRSAPTDVIADFSSGGPTPISLQLKPEVSAPGVNVVSSVPTHAGSWDTFSGTSMASPMVAGAAALLLQRHPDWTPAQVKSALVLTGDPAYSGTAKTVEAPTTREGGGVIDIPHANAPLIFDAPTTVSFGLMHRSTTAARSVTLTDAGGGAGSWGVLVVQQNPERGRVGYRAHDRDGARAAAAVRRGGLVRRRVRPDRVRRAHAGLECPPDSLLVPSHRAEARHGADHAAPPAGRLPGEHERQGLARLVLPLPAMRRTGSA